MNAFMSHRTSQMCRAKVLPIHEMDMGVASDVIVATITRFAVRIGLPGRPVPHSRQSLQTAHTASQKTQLRTSQRGVE